MRVFLFKERVSEALVACLVVGLKMCRLSDSLDPYMQLTNATAYHEKSRATVYITHAPRDKAGFIEEVGQLP